MNEPSSQIAPLSKSEPTPLIEPKLSSGPVIAAGLTARIDIAKEPTANWLWNFAGLKATRPDRTEKLSEPLKRTEPSYVSEPFPWTEPTLGSEPL